VVSPPPQPQDNSKSFLIGLSLNFVAPFGNVPKAGGSIVSGNNDVDIGQMFSSGGDIGLDVGLRLAKYFYLGLLGEFGTFGAGSATSTIPNATVSTSTFLLGLEGGLISNPDKVAFMGTVGFGLRSLKQSISGVPSSAQLPVLGQDANFSGFDVWGKVGVPIPIGEHIRLVPMAWLALGTLGRSNSDAISGSPSVSNTAIHGFAGLGLTGFYTGKM
jgi:hypothetical protein